MPEAFPELFATLRTAFQRLDQEGGGEAAAAFVRACGAMGAALVLHPAWREKPEFAAFIGESSKRFFSVNVDLGRYYTLVWDALREDWYDELVSVEYRNRRYEEVCRMWSDAVFMRELYAETNAFGEDFPFFTEDDDAFDTLVHRGRLQAEVVHDIDVPEGIPRSHFWWWLPDDPSLGDDYV